MMGTAFVIVLDLILALNGIYWILFALCKAETSMHRVCAFLLGSAFLSSIYWFWYL